MRCIKTAEEPTPDARTQETQSNWRMCPQDPVLGDEILDLQQQFLIDEPRHVGQETNPFAAFHPTDIFSSL
jgi:hypothetical protein